MRAFPLAACCALALISCTREKRDVRPASARVVVYGDAARESDLLPGGGARPVSAARNPLHGEAYAISEGARLFNWYNCSGCHANGGGGIGPPLMKEQWIYGGEPENLFDTLVKGRPNGMPSWGSRIPEYQMWQIVAYIRSLNGKEPQAATPARMDVVQNHTDTITNKVKGETK